MYIVNISYVFSMSFHFNYDFFFWAEDFNFYVVCNHYFPFRVLSPEREQPFYLPEGCEPAAHILRAEQ